MMISCEYGFGQHIFNLSKENRLMTLKVSSTPCFSCFLLSLKVPWFAVEILLSILTKDSKLFYVAQIFYKLTINLTKASILLLYLRIFIQKWFRICCYTLMAIILSYMVATTASSIWQCTPIRGAWDKSIGPTCISLTHNWYANAGFSIATDVLILLLPMQPIWTSKLPVNQKRALMFVFALGGL